MSGPTVDILLATYNGERYVGEQIESIQGQTYKDWRLLVSDDCSSDGTLGVVKSYAAGDSRISVASEGVRYGGAKENFFALMAKSSAPYVMFCDQDDFWLPPKVEKSLEAIHSLEAKSGKDKPLLVFCDMKVVDAGLGVISDSFETYRHFDPHRLSLRHLIAQNVAAGCCMLANRAALDLLDNSGQHERIEMHDWWLMLAVSAFGHIGYIEEPLSLYRQHGDNEVGAVKYSPLTTAKDIGFMEEQFLSVIDQAEAFLDSYGDMLPVEEAQSLKKFISIRCSKNPFQSMAALLSSGCLKKGLRVSGQMVVSVRISLGK